MPPKPAIDKSPHRNEIINKLLDGESSRSVSEWLKNTYNETISHTAINKYNKTHLDIIGKAKKKVEERKARKKLENKEYSKVSNEVNIEKKVDDTNNALADGIGLLQKNVKDKSKIVVNTDVNIDLEKETPLQREKFKHTVKHSANDDIRLLNEIYKGDPEPPVIHVYVEQIAKNKEGLEKSKNFLDSVDPNKI